jgi:hypothetical protein
VTAAFSVVRERLLNNLTCEENGLGTKSLRLIKNVSRLPWRSGIR